MSLPKNYLELEYISFPSGAYIDTNIIPSNHYTEIKVNDLSYVNDKHYIGTSTSSTSYYHFTTYSNIYYWGINSGESSGGTWTSGIHTLKYNYGSNYQVILDDVVLGSGTNISSTYNLLIGKRQTSANFVGYVYYCKVTDKSTDTLVRNYIPSMRLTDGVVGLYDLVNDTFYTNSGSGTFGYALKSNDDFSKVFRQVEYISFPSSAYIDTNIIPSNHFTEIKVNDLSYVNDKHWLGTSSSAAYYHFTTYSSKYYWGLNGSEGNGGTWTSGIHTLKYNYGDTYQVILDDVVLGSGVAIVGTSNLFIGKRQTSANFVGYVYYCKVTDKTTDTLVGDFIPCYSKIDSTIGLYDKVTKSFFTNQGSGTFTKGDDVYVVSTSANPSGSGTFSVTSSSLNNYVVTPTPSSNYQFVNWTIDGYTQLEYIESSGTQYIDTNYLFSNNDKLEFDYAFTTTSNTTNQLFCKGVSGASGGSLNFGYWQSSTLSLSNGSDIVSLSTYKDTNKHSVEWVLNDYIKVDDTSLSTSLSGLTNYTYSLVLFGKNQDGTKSANALVRLYEFKITSNDTLVRDFIPCIRHSDGQIGLLDKVNWKFYGNSGSGVFSGGSLND